MVLNVPEAELGPNFSIKEPEPLNVIAEGSVVDDDIPDTAELNGLSSMF
jgi:hypothetical protein